MKIKLIFLYIVFSQVISYSNVVWDTTYIRREILYNESIIEASFQFKNNGRDMLKFSHIAPSCGCLTVSLKKKEYQPQEHGILQVKTTFSNKQNVQKHYIDVFFNGQNESKTRLDIELIPYFPFKISTDKLVWMKGEEPIPKGILLKFPGERISVENIRNAITISNNTFRTYVLYDAESNSFEINIIPPQTNIFYAETLSIALDKLTPTFPKGNYIVNVSVEGNKLHIMSLSDFIKIKSKADKRVLIIDVRNKAFYDKGNIKGSINIPIKDIKENNHSYNNKKNAISAADIVVIYCSNKDCNDSEYAYHEILKIKENNVYIFKGGWFEWNEYIFNGDVSL